MKAQFDIFTGFSNSTWEGGSGDGEPIVHSSLSSPLSSNIGGTFCRRFVINKVNPQDNYYGFGSIVASIKTTEASGAYNAPGDDKAVDLRFTANSYNDNPRGGNVGVLCRYFHDASRALANTVEAFDGYGLSYGPVLNLGNEEHNGNGNNPAVQYLRLWARQMNQPGNSTPHYTEVRLPTNPVTQAAWVSRTWYRFRFIFTPVTDLLHLLVAQVLNSISADETVDNNWTEVGRLSIATAFDPWRVPFEAGQRVGFYSSQIAKEYNSGGAAVPSMLFDNFSARIANV